MVIDVLRLNLPLDLERVEEIFVRNSRVMGLVVRGRSIKTTVEHPFYVPAQNDFLPAGQIQAGDHLISHDGELVQVDAVHSTDEVTTVYNLRVADHHTYFVGGTIWGWDVWVHNASYVPKGTQNAETAWATKTGRAYDRWFRRFWRQFEGQTIGDGIEVAYVNRRLAKGIQPDLVLVDHQKKLVNIHDITSQMNLEHLAKGETYVDFFKKKFKGYDVEYTESYWRGKENRIPALSSSGVKYLPGTTRP